MTTQTKRPGRPKKVVAQPKKATRPQKEKPLLPVEYKMLNPSGKLFMMGSTEHSIFSKETSSIRIIRYCEKEPSIYVDEQSERPTKSTIRFVDGRLFVPPEKPNLIEFLDTHPGNLANGGNLFERVDIMKKVKSDLKTEFLQMDAIALLRERPLDDIMAVATSLNVNTDREVDEIKHDLLVFAKRNPETFIKSFDNPVTKMRAKLKTAADYGIINFNDGHVRWNDTNKHIIAIPAGQDGLNVFVRYCMTEAGVPVLSEIERQLG